MPENQQQNVALLRAKRHPYADLVCALRDGVSNHTVNSDCCQDQRDDGEDAQQ